MSVSLKDLRCSGCGGRIEEHWTVCGWCGHRLTPGAAGVVDGIDPVAGGAADDTLASVALVSGGLLLSRYRIDAVLGRGGFGITYRARDTRLDRDVAIKELFPPGAVRRGESVIVAASDRVAFEAARRRFQREATALARFGHPGIVRIFEVFEANATAYLVMELIRGSSVGELLRERAEPFGVPQVLDMILRVGDALRAVHEAGLLHRDINPSNLMVEGSRRVVLIDFGLARAFGEGASGSVTRAVTPGYAPPEQYAGSTRDGPPGDVFGLAATAYKLLTGATPTNVFDRQAGALLAAPDALRAGIPPLVSAGILDGMELDPRHRPATIGAFLNRLGLHGATPGPRVLLTDPAPFAPDVIHSAAVVAPSDTPNARGAGPHMRRSVTPAVPPPAPLDRVAAPPLPAPPELSPPPIRSVPDRALPSAPSPGVAPTSYRSPAPWHDGSPPVIGSGPRWRGWVTWPCGVAVVALASASPIIVSAALTVVILPLLATVGDLQVHRHRRRAGIGRRRWQDARSATVAPVRFIRNLAVALLRSLPAIAVAAIGYATVQVFTDSGVNSTARDLTIRVTGVMMSLVLLLPARHGGRGFRTDLGITAGAEWVMEHRTRPGVRTFAVWIVAVAVTAFGILFDPEMWPFT